jgi:hypothetical protein
MKRARDGAVDERCVRDVDQIGENRRGQHGHRARATRHRENRREGQAGIAQLRMQTRMLRGCRMIGRVNECGRLRQEQGESERNTGKQSWCAARQSGGFLESPWIVELTDCAGNLLDIDRSSRILHASG